MKCLLKATIDHSESDVFDSLHYDERVDLKLFRDVDGRYRWYCKGEDTEVSAPTIAEARNALYDAWGRGWGLQTTWKKH